MTLFKCQWFSLSVSQGPKWTEKKKWPSRLTEDEKARFLTKNGRKKRNDMQKIKRSSMDSIYFFRDNKELSFFLSERHKLFYNSNYWTRFSMFAKPDIDVSRFVQLSRILQSLSRDYIRLCKQGKCFLLLNCRTVSIRLKLDITPNWVSCKDILSWLCDVPGRPNARRFCCCLHPRRRKT